MVDFSDEFGPKNDFFNLLHDKYSALLLKAQKQSMLICIPHSDTIANSGFTLQFVNHHILQASPYIKSQFIARIDRDHEEEYRIQNGEISNASLSMPAKILYEEVGYDKDFNEYQTVLIDRPLDPNYKYNPLKKKTSSSLTDVIIQGEREWNDMPTQLAARKFLNGQIGDFNDHYTILIDFLDHAIFKIKEMCEQTMKKAFTHVSTELDSFDNIPIWIYVENYTLMKAYDKVFYVCCKKCKKKDHELFRLMSSSQGITIRELDIPAAFDFEFLSAKNRISDLSTNHTPFAKLKCIADTLDLIASESQSQDNQEKRLYNSQEPPPITADILIPLFSYVLLRAQASLLCANLLYLNSFSWHTLRLPKLSYAVVTFQASLQLILSHIGVELEEETPSPADKGTHYVSQRSSLHSQGRRGSLVHVGDASSHPLDENWDESFEIINEKFVSISESTNKEQKVLLNGASKASEWGFLSRFKRHSIADNTNGLFSPTPRDKTPLSKVSSSSSNNNNNSPMRLDNVLALLTTKDEKTSDTK